MHSVINVSSFLCIYVDKEVQVHADRVSIFIFVRACC